MLAHELENVDKCSFEDFTLFIENFKKWSLNFGKGAVDGAKLRGEDTCHGVASISAPYWKMPSFLITFWGLLGMIVGMNWLNMLPLVVEPEEVELVLVLVVLEVEAKDDILDKDWAKEGSKLSIREPTTTLSKWARIFFLALTLRGMNLGG